MSKSIFVSGEDLVIGRVFLGWKERISRIIDRGITRWLVHRRFMRITETNLPVLMPVCISSVAHCLKLSGNH